MTSHFLEYCRARERAAAAAVLPPYKTIAIDLQHGHFHAIGNAWTRAFFDGEFYRSASNGDIPVTNLVFVESREGNTGADDPSTLGGGETDKHLVYEGLARVDADAVFAGATTARSDNLVFSVWHPELVKLRLDLGRPRHPAHVVVVSRSSLHFESALMFQQPEMPVYLVTTSDAAASLRLQVATRPWISVIDGGQPLSMRTALRALKSRGIETMTAIGGRTTARAMLREGVIRDLYLTTSPKSAGEPNTPLLNEPINVPAVVIKKGTGREEGVRFTHYAI